MTHVNIHVVPNGNKWEVKRQGNPTPISSHNLKGKAVDSGRIWAKNQESELVIHRKDGTIQDKDSYGKDPYPPKDKRY